MHIERDNLSVLAKVTQVSDVPHGPLARFWFCFCFPPKKKQTKKKKKKKNNKLIRNSKTHWHVLAL
jgi:hypothetical protein